MGPLNKMRTSKSPAAALGLPEDDFRGPEEDVTVEFGGKTPKTLSVDELDVAAPEELAVEELDDGSAVVLEPENDEPGNSEFDENMAETLDSGELARIGQKLLENIELDKKTREQRDKDYAEGLKRTGLGDQAPGGAEFKGASKVVHPVLMEACIDFSARAMKELFPAKGPVKTHIIGKQTDAKLERADRKRQYMNWQLTKQISEYRPSLERLLTQLPLGGGQYLKFWQDPDFERVRTEFVPIDDIFVPYACDDFYSTPRLTHAQHLTRDEFDRRVANKMYREGSYKDASGSEPEKTAAAIVNDRIEGKEDPAYNNDGLRDVFEVQVYLEIEDDKFARKGRKCPYVVTIEDTTGYVLGMRRNWEEDDEKCRKLEWIVEWPMFPWRGAIPIGLAQAMGGLPATTTGALRALLDSAHISNFPAALKLKGSRVSGQTIELQATGLTDIEGPTAVDDIRKLVMPLPFPGPSPVLFELMKYCVDTAKSLISTADDKIAEGAQNAPVGTTLALIEQGSITFSSVHARLHEAQRRSLEILHRLNGEYLEDEETVEELGELVVRREDFQGPMDVVPVSDPNIFSDSQRYAQLQAVMQLNQQFPGMLKAAVLVERALKLLNYPDYEEVLNAPGSAEELDAVQENIVARDPLKQIKVYAANDDVEHLKLHLQFLSSPLFCANPLMAIPAMPQLLKHCMDHIAALYEKHARAAQKAASAVHLAQGAEGETDTTSGLVIAEQTLAAELGPLMEHLTKAAEDVKKFMPQPQLDPAAQAQMQIANIREQGAAQREQLKQQSETQRAQAESTVHQALAQAALAAEDRENNLQRQFDDRQAQLERAVQAHNVEVAEASERQAQQLGVMTAKLREDAAAQRLEMQAAFNTELEKLRSSNKIEEMVVADLIAPPGPEGGAITDETSKE